MSRFLWADGGNLTLTGTGTALSVPNGVASLPQGVAQTHSGAFSGGTNYAGDFETSGASLFINSTQGIYNVNAAIYPGGVYGYGCVITETNGSSNVGFYGNATSQNAYGGIFVAIGSTIGAGALGGVFHGGGFSGQTSGQTEAAYFGITSLSAASSTYFTNAVEVTAEGASTYAARCGIQFTNENTTQTFPAFGVALQFGGTGGATKLVTLAYISDDQQGAAGTAPSTPAALSSAPYGILFDATTFTVAAIQTPGFTVDGSGNTTVNRLQLTGTTVAALPAASTALKGAMMFVTDATSPTYNGPLTGGGTVAVPVFCNGSTWTSH